MIRYFRQRPAILSTLAILSALAFADRMQAGSLSFRNDTAGPVIVQAMGVVQGRVVAGTRHLLQPGATSSDLVVRPGNKLILIVDAKRPTQTLYMDAILFPAASLNKFYSIQAADPPLKGKPPAGAPARVKLVETQVPTNPMQRTAPATPKR
jgi:hypothetical protein